MVSEQFQEEHGTEREQYHLKSSLPTFKPPVFSIQELYCPFHEGQPLIFFCSDDSQLICEVCFSLNHTCHSVQKKSEIY
jgi:hypothetical protein